MEHRLHQRHEAGITAWVSKRGSEPAEVRIVNVSRGGLLIEAPALRLWPHQLLDIHFQLPFEGRIHRFAVRTMVVRLSGKAAGLEALNGGAAGHAALGALVDCLKQHGRELMLAV